MFFIIFLHLMQPTHLLFQFLNADARRRLFGFDRGCHSAVVVVLDFNVDRHTAHKVRLAGIEVGIVSGIGAILPIQDNLIANITAFLRGEDLQGVISLKTDVLLEHSIPEDIRLDSRRSKSQIVRSRRRDTRRQINLDRLIRGGGGRGGRNRAEREAEDQNNRKQNRQIAFHIFSFFIFGAISGNSKFGYKAKNSLITTFPAASCIQKC